MLYRLLSSIAGRSGSIKVCYTGYCHLLLEDQGLSKYAIQGIAEFVAVHEISK